MARTFQKFYYDEVARKINDELDEGMAGDIGRKFGQVAGRAVQGMADFKNQAVAGYRDVRGAPSAAPSGTPEAPQQQVAPNAAPQQQRQQQQSSGRKVMTHPDSFSSTFTDPTSPISQFAGILKDLQRDVEEGKTGTRKFSSIRFQGKGKDGKPVNMNIDITASPPMF